MLKKKKKTKKIVTVTMLNRQIFPSCDALKSACATDRGQSIPVANGPHAVNLGSDTTTTSPWTPEMLCHKLGSAVY